MIPPVTLFSYAFRVFFLFSGVAAVILVVAWMVTR